MSWQVQEKNIGGNVKLTPNISGKYLQIQLLTQNESWVIALTAQVERDGTLPSFQNLPHVPHLPPKYPHPNSHYQPLTTKAFIQIRVIATGVASPVTLDKICPIMLRSFR
jgi:hypothetical protein